MTHSWSGPVFCMTIHLPPVPASRPRVSKWGTYYAKTYKNYKAALENALEKVGGQFSESDDLDVQMYFALKRPKKTKFAHPAEDIDNLFKAASDACNGRIWPDDRQIVRTVCEKKWVELGKEKTLIYVSVGRDDGL